MNFVWFWTFWHWSKEGFRDGSLLLNPLHGIGSHWDEWFRHEASGNDLRSIEVAGRTTSNQRRFIAWLLSRWATEADSGGKLLARRFVLAQLAQVKPFCQWEAFKNYRAESQLNGISAIVLAENSLGSPEDVRAMDAALLPPDPTTPAVVTEGFHADSIDLETSRRAAIGVLRGQGFWMLLGLWILSGTRPYPRWLIIGLNLCWLAVGGLIAGLLFGPDPGSRLFVICAVLIALWSGLAVVAIVTAAIQTFRAWQQGHAWSAGLEQGQVRLRMSGGLTLKGGSAGLPFCLNMLLAACRSNVGSTRGSWIWQRVFQNLRRDTGHWTATGVITADGFLKPVILEAKLRACLQRAGIEHILTPRQSGAGKHVVNRVAETIAPLRQELAASRASNLRLGFAAEGRALQIHPCRHVAQVLLRLNGLTSTSQMLINIFAIAASFIMLCALPDLRAILIPPPAPMAIKPSSPAPDYLWVSLDTTQPERFLVVLESRFWRNRRVDVAARSDANGSTRAEIRLVQAISIAIKDPDDGVVWVERRPRFLNRYFASGERVGRYDLSYLKRLGHE